MTIKKSIYILSIPVVLAACQAGPRHNESSATAAAENNEASSTFSDSTIIQQQPTVYGIPGEKMMIRTANLRGQVDSVALVRQRVYDIVRGYGGYIASDDEKMLNYYWEGKVTLMIPNEHFEEAVLKLSQISSKLDSKTITVEDVRKQFKIDSLRIVNSKATIQTIQKAATKDNANEALHAAVNMQENAFSAEVRRIELVELLKMSTISCEFYANIPVVEPPAPSYFSRVGDAFSAGFSWLGDFIIILVTVWPLWLIIAGLLFAYKAFKRRLKTKVVE
ncbi:uncharacterized protein DUF4349 [Chitinophaga skermanii]|uniref:Uncharacterized protein DUF4349 n=1 Tax=Chitinophaga skermanii TaxID=331697 RepID=A0A327QR66_9BACT|nr:DUF4349 domain-containing protein [Chitinophaga skermanii]RAJ06810.1 uncharacterized protein DUF4349 [Chitinophaga skermanii]